MIDKFELDYMEFYEECQKVVTDSPIDEVWNKIISLGDVNYLSQRWINRKPEDYIYVSTSIKQSYEYFKASKATSMKTRPLLLYYCFLNLTKAILFMLTDYRPNKDYHGLCNEDISEEIKTSSDFLNFSAQINNGVFLELAKYYKWNIAKGTRITLEDFCSSAIELVRTYVDYFQKPSKFVFPKVRGRSNGNLEIIFNKELLDYIKADSKEIIRKFSTEDGFLLTTDDINLKFNCIINQGDDYKAFKNKAISLLKEKMSFSVFAEEVYYFDTRPDNMKIPNANAYFGIMFILSSIVRYKPEHIYSLIDDKDISVLWFLSRICDLSERVYPNLMVNALNGTSIKYVFGSTW